MFTGEVPSLGGWVDNVPVSSRSKRPSAQSLATNAWARPQISEAFNLIDILETLPDPVSGSDDPELGYLFDADQADRVNNVLAVGSAQRDQARRARGMQKLGHGEIRTSRDFYHLAMLLQHGGLAEHYHLGHELARRAWKAGYEPAGWLAAATLDRWLMHVGLPQKFGTQYSFSNGCWRVYPVDATVSDDERMRWGVPRLEQAYERAEQMNREGD